MQNSSKVNYRDAKIAERKKTEFYHKMPTLVDETPIYFFLGTKQLKTMARQKAKLRRPHSHSLTDDGAKQ